jgi:hypothetical protein
MKWRVKLQVCAVEHLDQQQLGDQVYAVLSDESLFRTFHVEWLLGRSNWPPPVIPMQYGWVLSR